MVKRMSLAALVAAVALPASAALPAAANAQLIELGRCQQVTKGTGLYSSYTCNVGGAEGKKHNYEWFPGAIDGGFVSDWNPRPGKPPVPNETSPSWELGDGRIVQCVGGEGKGHHISRLEDREVVTSVGCELQGQSCRSGAQAGEVVTSELALSYQPIGPAINWGTIFQPAAPGPFVAFDCGAAHFDVNGSLVTQTPNNPTASVWRQVKISRHTHGVQSDPASRRAGTPYRGFTATISEAGTTREQSIALKAIYIVTNNEPLRVRISK